MGQIARATKYGKNIELEIATGKVQNYGSRTINYYDRTNSVSIFIPSRLVKKVIAALQKPEKHRI